MSLRKLIVAFLLFSMFSLASRIGFLPRVFANEGSGTYVGGIIRKTLHGH